MRNVRRCAVMRTLRWVLLISQFVCPVVLAQDVQSPTTPTGFSAVASSSTAVVLSWIASTDNVAVAGYQVERCQGVACNSSFTQFNIAGAGWANTGLTASTTYGYRVRARDAAPNYSAFTGIVYVTTLAGAGDTQAPTIPTGFSAVASSNTTVVLNWIASTDNVAVTGYQVERCQGAACNSSFTQFNIAGAGWANTGLTASTTYGYRVRARDAAPNYSTFTSIVYVTTLAGAGDTQAPTIPGSLSATASSSTQVNVGWSASTDNVAVTGYQLERCLGASCNSSFTQFNISSTGYTDSGLTASTTYGYRVRARDAAPNYSTFTSIVYVTTPATGAGQVTYTYDDAGRLMKSAYHDYFSKTYTLDAAGNRVGVQGTQGSGSLQFGAATYSIAESGGTLNVSVTRTGTPVAAVSVQYATTNGTAISGTDYTATTGTVSWAAGDGAGKTIALPIIEDGSVEGSETFTIVLSTPMGGAIIGAIGSAVATITDNDAVVLSIANTTVSESGAAATFTVSKSATSALPHSVSYATANGTAVAGSDYTATAGTLSFAASETTKSFTVPILNNNTLEANETFTATLSSPTNGATLGASVGTATITNDDVVSFSVTGVSINESSSPAILIVSKTGASSLDHVVTYATSNGTAVAGSDYTAASGTLTFLALDPTAKSFAVAIANDATFEMSETIAVTLSSPTNGATLGAASANVTILDNDSAPVFSITNASVNEASGTASVIVSRAGASEVTQTVNVATVNGSAVAGADYVASSTTLSFAAGQTTATFPVTLIDDAVYERGEDFYVSLSSPTGEAVIAPGADVALVSIEDSDSPPSFAVGDVSLSENGVWAVVTVNKVGATAFTHAVTIATSDGAAIAPADYQASGTTWNFGPGDVSRTLSVRIYNDNLHESNETLTATLTAPTNSATLSDPTATITIVDDDPVSLPPPPPAAVIAPDTTTNTTVGFSWGAVEGATSYELWRVTPPLLRIYSGSSTATSKSLAPGFIYEFYAKACNEFACSNPSPVKQVTVDCPVSCL